VDHKKSQLIFICNVVKNQRILMQFSLLDFEMNVYIVKIWTSPTSHI